MRRFTHFAAIDWSGARGPRQRGIALAVAQGDAAPALVRPGHVWARAELLDWLEARADAGDDMLIGFDFSAGFAFADRGGYFPGWDESPADLSALWALVERLTVRDPHLEVGAFLAHPQARRHFRHARGDVGDLFEPGTGRLRIVEHHQRTTRQAASVSNFNLVGAAQVGKASLAGMRVLHRLRGRIPLWPLDPVPAKGPVLVKIYTSLAARAAGLAAGGLDVAAGRLLVVGHRCHRALSRSARSCTFSRCSSSFLRSSSSFFRSTAATRASSFAIWASRLSR